MCLIFSQRLIGWWLRCGWSPSRLIYMWVSGHGACLTSFWEAYTSSCFSTWRTDHPGSGWQDSIRYKHTHNLNESMRYIHNNVMICFSNTLYWAYQYAENEYGFKGIEHALFGAVPLSNGVTALLFLCCVGDAAGECYTDIGCIWHPDWCIMG